MDRSTYPLLSEKEFVEIAGRMLAGEYKTTTGFIRDLADFLLTAGDSAMTRNREYSRDIYFLSEHHLIESIITWQAWQGISGLMAIRESSLNSAKWSLLSSIQIIGIGVLQLSLLAQILQANELNLLAIAVLLALLAIDTLADRGFSNTIIRRCMLSINDLSILYWGNMLMGAAVFGLLFVSSHLLNRMFDQPELALMLEMVSVVFIIIPQGQQYRAILQREKQYTRIAFAETSSVLAGLSVTLFTVWLTPSVLCAIWGYLAMASIRMLIYCYYGRSWFQPEYRFSLKKFSQIRARNK